MLVNPGTLLVPRIASEGIDGVDIGVLMSDDEIPILTDDNQYIYEG